MVSLDQVGVVKAICSHIFGILDDQISVFIKTKYHFVRRFGILLDRNMEVLRLFEVLFPLLGFTRNHWGALTTSVARAAPPESPVWGILIPPRPPGF